MKFKWPVKLNLDVKFNLHLNLCNLFKNIFSLSLAKAVSFRKVFFEVGFVSIDGMEKLGFRFDFCVAEISVVDKDALISASTGREYWLYFHCFWCHNFNIALVAAYTLFKIIFTEEFSCHLAWYKCSSLDVMNSSSCILLYIFMNSIFKRYLAWYKRSSMDVMKLSSCILLYAINFIHE